MQSHYLHLLQSRSRLPVGAASLLRGFRHHHDPVSRTGRSRGPLRPPDAPALSVVRPWDGPTASPQWPPTMRTRGRRRRSLRPVGQAHLFKGAPPIPGRSAIPRGASGAGRTTMSWLDRREPSNVGASASGEAAHPDTRLTEQSRSTRRVAIAAVLGTGRDPLFPRGSGRPLV